MHAPTHVVPLSVLCNATLFRPLAPKQMARTAPAPSGTPVDGKFDGASGDPCRSPEDFVQRAVASVAS